MYGQNKRLFKHSARHENVWRGSKQIKIAMQIGGDLLVIERIWQNEEVLSKYIEILFQSVSF